MEFIPLLTLGFGLGLLHALDADHIMAVSMLSTQKKGLIPVLKQSFCWGLGHSVVLLLSGALFFGLGMALPETVRKLAEASVGVLLIVLGLMWTIRFHKHKLSLKSHTHGDITHIHWHDDTHSYTRKETHKPIFVGLLHGLAGSAPALSMIPAVTNAQLLHALLYLTLFSFGVMLSMLGFGFGFARIQQVLSDRFSHMVGHIQQFLAFISIILGGVWLFQAV